MLESTRAKLLERLAPDDVVLDIGSWADPFERANWVVDLFPYETRGLYARRGWINPRADAGLERFSKQTWIERDLSSHEPLPFGDDELDFVICSHTLEDIRDPVWACAEMQRVARAGYIEVPSRLEEQAWGVAGEFVGWSHHHWLIDIDSESIEFVFKPHAIHADPDCYFPASFWERLTEEERVQSLWWDGSFSFRERVIFEQTPGELSRYLGDFVAAEIAARGVQPPRRSLATRARARSAVLLGRARALRRSAPKEPGR